MRRKESSDLYTEEFHHFIAGWGQVGGKKKVVLCQALKEHGVSGRGHGLTSSTGHQRAGLSAWGEISQELQSEVLHDQPRTYFLRLPSKQGFVYSSVLKYGEMEAQQESVTCLTVDPHPCFNRGNKN